MRTMTLQRILYAEDEPLIQAVAKLALEKVGGFEVLICSSGTQALEQARDFAPDLVLLDVVMPGMDGPTTFEHLRQNPDTANLPVVFLTANTQADEVQQYLALGAVGVLAKPFNPMTLAQDIRQVWARHEARA